MSTAAGPWLSAAELSTVLAVSPSTLGNLGEIAVGGGIARSASPNR